MFIWRIIIYRVMKDQISKENIKFVVINIGPYS
jgi:hypothetical protein